ncbi:MATE efflux family protein 5-like, partial [Trifolium medium]|nr:MATE efflux family protein 5-like [Trifolium medium]
GSSLQSPLLQIISVQKDDTEAVAEQYKKKRVVESERRKDFFEEVKKQLWLAGPLTSASLLNFGIQIISVMFVGHLGELPLSGASMATSFTSVTGISVLVRHPSLCYCNGYFFYFIYPNTPFYVS